ncbi:hypothetical protein FKP32DRAFT_1591280 [Trametes sanguinea]|nr:hypothetical protein FKP32DRAFT_1591280 [Trametes sanguinea]
MKNEPVAHPGIFLGQLPAESLARALRRRVRKDSHLLKDKELHRIISTLASTISDVRHVLNQQEALDRKLPVEVLAIIFRHVVDMASASAAPIDSVIWTGSEPATHALLTLALVCRRWYDILSNYSAVWSTISDEHMDAANMFLQYSRQRPVNIHLRTNGSADALQLPPFISAPDVQCRMRELHWVLSPCTLRKTEFLCFPAPLLEQLCLRFDGHRDVANRVSSPILFVGQTPLLRVLDLGFVPWLPGNHFDALTHLSLVDILPGADFTDFIVLFRNCPRLEHLVLVGIEVFAPEHDPPSQGLADKPTLLPNLRRLTFDSMSNVGVNDFLDYINLRREDVALQVLNVPLSDLYVPEDFVEVSSPTPIAAEALTSLALIRPTWCGPVTIAATGPSTAIRLISAPVDVYDEHWGPNAHVEWALPQLDRFPLDRIEHFFISLLSFPKRPFPLVREVATRIARMSQLRELTLWTTDLQRLLTSLFFDSQDSSLLPFQNEVAPEWRLQVLRIVVDPPADVPPDPAAAFEVEEPLEIAHIDRIVIECPHPRRTYNGIVRTLNAAYCRSVQYAATSDHRGFCFPDICYDPMAHRDWVGGQWDPVS